MKSYHQEYETPDNLTFQDRRIAIKFAYDNLSEDCRAIIYSQAARLVEIMKTEHPNVPFSMDNALELLYQLGRWSAKNDIRSFGL
jgi:hypothetical protein